MIIVVTGLPRSGTSLIMQMLEAGGCPILADETRPADADNPLGYFEYERVKHLARDSSWLEAADGHAVKIVSPLLRYLPGRFEYRVIFVERSLVEIIRSQEVMLKRRGEKGAAVTADKLAHVYERHLRETRAYLARQPNMHVMFIRYADVVACPKAGAERLREHVGLPLDAARMAAVVDPKLYRQRAE